MSPVATTWLVSLTAVPAQVPKKTSERPSSRPRSG